MEIYVALVDSPGAGPSYVLGAFSAEDQARAACQADAETPAPLVWEDAEADDTDGDRYAVILTELDVPI